LALDYQDIPETFGRIFHGAFNPQAASGGFLGAAMIMAIRAGVARGLFSNEAGQGSTPIAHAVAQTDDPEQQGRMAMLGTFIDTIVICTMTALVILTVEGNFTAGGQPVLHAWQSDLNGFAMTSGAFAAAFPFTIASIPVGTLIASLALILFVFTTLLTWSYYGERAITFIYDRVPGSTLQGEKRLHLSWRVLWCLVILSAASRTWNWCGGWAISPTRRWPCPTWWRWRCCRAWCSSSRAVIARPGRITPPTRPKNRRSTDPRVFRRAR
jgi:alanine or glycine:cation symporter, AGCS family